MWTELQKELCINKGKPLRHTIDKNGCWIVISHQATINGKYVRIGRNKKGILAHRYVYEKCHGKIPPGMVIMHTCDNGLCINPYHLQLGTPKDNVHDCCHKGRIACGERHGKAKLTNAQVQKILIDNLTPYKNIAIQYGIDPSRISCIKNGKAWKHLSKGGKSEAKINPYPRHGSQRLDCV